MIDTHCHLEMEQFNEDRDAVIARARAAGVEILITIGSDIEGCEGAVELSRKLDFVYAAVGVHPHDAKDFSDEVAGMIRSWVAESRGYDAACMEVNPPKIVAIGEIGLDYYYDHSPRHLQREGFARQLDIAKELDLPVVVHSRDAVEDTMCILEASGVRKGIMHCFSGDLDMARRAMELGLHISFAGTVTFKKAVSLKEVAAMVPDEFLLIETDAPYLAPVPMRGKRNEPAFIVHTAKHIAELRGITLQDIDRITTLNAKRLFGIGNSGEAQIAYRIRDSLYLNITNRCTNKCSFCIRYQSDFVKGHNLRLHGEPTAKELQDAIGDPRSYREVVFCGYGEPMLRLDVVKSVAAWIKEQGGVVRINTNGQGNVINGKNVLPELKGIVDALSVSLDAPDEETYDRVCRPTFKGVFDEVVGFLREAKTYIPDVQATVVEMEGVDVDRCRRLADELGVKLRVRKLDVVG
ncbi:MAG TPA: TatD family hydrolase [Dissulfurispiraceae bacterium]|nr:TatD family hydrolase [Dissulfurispiraceae bacterium]